jgi:uncharacterized protein (DUF924 family)
MPTDQPWNSILESWFDDCRGEPELIGGRMTWWFGADPDRDRHLAEAYSSQCESALSGQLATWQPEPQSRLALILLLDQLPRNLFRGTARAFSGDDRAAMLSLSGVAAGIDRKLSPAERIFFYMPLEHAEDLITQQVSVKLFSELNKEQARHAVFGGCANYAQKHLDLIEQFGRFPHRNEILGRESTAAEIEYLESGGERFGQ